MFVMQLNFEKLKARILKKYYVMKTSQSEKRFRYKLDEDASTTLKNALEHQENQRKYATATTLAQNGSTERWAKRSGENGRAVSLALPHPPGVIESLDLDES